MTTTMMTTMTKNCFPLKEEEKRMEKRRLHMGERARDSGGRGLYLRKDKLFCL